MPTTKKDSDIKPFNRRLNINKDGYVTVEGYWKISQLEKALRINRKRRQLTGEPI